MNDKQQYLDVVLKPIMENLVLQLVIDRPDNVIDFMINWLAKNGNIDTKPLSIKEKAELEKLRENVKYYKDKEMKENNPTKKESGQKIEEDDDDYEEEEVQAQTINKEKMTAFNKKHRSGVSAEVYGTFNPKKEFVPRFIKKNDDQIQRIKNKILQSFIFSNIDQKDVNIIIGAMEEKIFEPDDVVISQGESGECLYIIESGELDCFKKFNPNEDKKYLKTYKPGESFGELALLYNAPRAATIISKTKSILWALDRETFNNIVKESARKKREQYESFLKSVEIFSTVETYELGQICDALKPLSFNEGEYVIKEVYKINVGRIGRFIFHYCRRKSICN
jgi:cAMP-dependent protein kinase regulator